MYVYQCLLKTFNYWVNFLIEPSLDPSLLLINSVIRYRHTGQNIPQVAPNFNHLNLMNAVVSLMVE